MLTEDNPKVKAAPAAEPLFDARGLAKVYRVGDVDVRALDGVDLSLGAGEFVVILGPSGSGKSTLLNILGGIDSPTAGRVRFRDHDLVAADARELTRYRREHVGFVFQFYNLIPSLTARENVALVTDIAEDPMRPLARRSTRSAMLAIAALCVMTTAVVPSSALTRVMTSSTSLPVS